MQNNDIEIPIAGVHLAGQLALSEHGVLVIFAHGSGSSHKSPRNQFVANLLQHAGFGTLLFDLLTLEEEQTEAQTRHLRFDIQFLAERLLEATRWVRSRLSTSPLKIGYFGASTGAAAALVAAAELGTVVKAVVSRGGRPDLARDSLETVTAPTRLIVGEQDTDVIALNQLAYDRLQCEKDLQIIDGASHLFQEAGALEKVASIASEWFRKHLQ